MLKLPRLVQYDISNLAGTHSMKTLPAQGWGEHSRHAPKAMGASAGAATAPWHTPASLWHGDGSDNLGPRGVRGSLEGTGFPAAALLPVPGSIPDTAEKGARLAAVVLSPELHKAMMDTPCPCSQGSGPWCPAKGSRPSLSSGGICRRVCKRLQGNRAHWREEHVERGAAVPGCMSGVTPDMLTCPSSFLGQGTCAGVVWPCERPGAPCWGFCHMGKPPRAPPQRGALVAP